MNKSRAREQLAFIKQVIDDIRDTLRNNGLNYIVWGSNILLGNTWMIVLACGWWAGTVALFFIPTYSSPILICIMVLIFEIIPGIIFYTTWKNKQKKR